MIISVALIGLVFIAVAWLVQSLAISKKKKELRKEFIWLYAIGVILLVADGFMNGLKELAIMNLVVFVLALITVVKLKK